MPDAKRYISRPREIPSDAPTFPVSRDYVVPPITPIRLATPSYTDSASDGGQTGNNQLSLHFGSRRTSPKCVAERTGKKRVQLVHFARRAEVDGLVSKVDNESTEEFRVDLHANQAKAARSASTLWVVCRTRTVTGKEREMRAFPSFRPETPVSVAPRPYSRPGSLRRRSGIVH